MNAMPLVSLMSLSLVFGMCGFVKCHVRRCAVCYKDIHEALGHGG